LILAEKPSQARAIAYALGASKTEYHNQVAYHVGNNIIVAAAVGHLFTLESKVQGWTYPKFEFEWTPTWVANKAVSYAKKYFDCLSMLIKQYHFDRFIVGCDYDIEGCLPRDEKVMIKQNKAVQLKNIGDIAESLFEGGSVKRWGRFDYVNVAPNSLLTLLLGKEDKIKFGQVRKVMRREGDGELLLITTELGRQVKTSRNHPFLVLTKRGWNIKKAENLCLGDFVPVIKQLPALEETETEIDVIDACSSLMAEFYVYGTKSVISLMPAAMSKMLGVKRKTCLGWRFFSRMPLWAYLKLETDKARRKELRIGVRKAKVKIPAIIPLDAQFGRLIGYYLAEGCVDTSGFVGAYFGPHEKMLADEANRLFMSVFKLDTKIKSRYHETRGGFAKISHCYEVGTKGKIIALLFKDVLDVGSNCYVKRLPKNIFSSPQIFQTNLIDAYLLGDGSLFQCSKDKSYVISAASVSKDLIDGLQFLLLKWGINAMLIRDQRRKVTISSLSLRSNSFEKMATLGIDGLFKRSGVVPKILFSVNSTMSRIPSFILRGCSLRPYPNGNSRRIGERVHISSIGKRSPLVEDLLKSGMHLLKIKKIQRLKYHGPLYDFETESGTIQHGNAVVTHNSVIGAICFKMLGVPEKAMFRMKMNSLMKSEVQRAYNNLSPPDFEWIEAGWARHNVDAVYGINLTIVLSKAVVEATKVWRTISMGRVQSPSLKFVVDREREILSFVPEKYWVITADLLINGKKYVATHKLGDIKDEELARQIFFKCVGAKTAVVDDVAEKVEEMLAPFCFSLPTLQREAWKVFHFSPAFTDKLAQNLYTQTLSSYPRTGTTAMKGVPCDLILDAFAKSPVYGIFVDVIRKNGFKPRFGGVSDGAHIALTPTANNRDSTDVAEKKLLDLIRRRFIATYYPPAKRKTMTVTFLINAEPFLLAGTKTVERGWLEPYKYLTLPEEDIPVLKRGDVVVVEKINLVEKLTKPPPRYTLSALVLKMERDHIGTKATRADICQKLLQRGYVDLERSVIKPTDLGMKLVGTAEKYFSFIINVALTRELEESLEGIENNTAKREVVVQKAINVVSSTIEQLRPNILIIGKELGSAQAPVTRQTYHRYKKRN